MTEERITSRKNPLLQTIRKLLASRKEREKQGLFVADGTKLLEEAIRYCKELDTVILTDDVNVDLPDFVRRIRVSGDVMASISPMEAPQGALFLCRYPVRTEPAYQAGMLLIDGIQDPGNLGTILRTADALQVPAVLLEGCADPYNHKTVRASMGAIFRTPVIQARWDAVHPVLQDKAIALAVTALKHDAVDIRTVDLRNLAVVIGSEGNGVRREILDAADISLIIPMSGHCESLNAAAAAAIVMWQMTSL